MLDTILILGGLLSVCVVVWAATTERGQRLFYALGLASLVAGMLYAAGEVGTLEVGPLRLGATEVRVLVALFVGATVLSQWSSASSPPEALAGPASSAPPVVSVSPRQVALRQPRHSVHSGTTRQAS